MAPGILLMVAMLCMAGGAPVALAQAANIAPPVCVKPPYGKSPPPPRTTTTSTTAPGVNVNVTCEASGPLPVAEGPKLPPHDPNPPQAPTPPVDKPPGGSSPAAPGGLGASPPMSGAPMPARGASAPSAGNPPAKRPEQAPTDATAQEWGVREGVMLATTLAALALLLVGAWVVVAALDLLPAKSHDREASTGPLQTFSGVPLRAPEIFTFRRHWGSFGGESTGWNISSNLMRLLMGIALMTVGVWLLLSAIEGTSRPAREPAAADAPVKPAPKTGADAK